MKPTKRLVIAYAVLNNLNETPVTIKSLSSKLNLNQTKTKAICLTLIKNGLVKVKVLDNQKAGLYVDSKADMNKLVKVFKAGSLFPEWGHAKLTELLQEQKNFVYCDICENKTTEFDKHNICVDCQNYDASAYDVKRLAKCGHWSRKRYFKCESCEPGMIDDSCFHENYYTVHLSG
ncbi:hypothetical protein EBZ38_13285 [bacterium]|nr:hypothetical protein [bacterium]